MIGFIIAAIILLVTAAASTMMAVANYFSPGEKLPAYETLLVGAFIASFIALSSGPN